VGLMKWVNEKTGLRGGVMTSSRLEN